VKLLGGTLTIRIGADCSMRMTGPAQTVYEGTAEV
jgi:diaminopimelate epimerase